MTEKKTEKKPPRVRISSEEMEKRRAKYTRGPTPPELKRLLEKGMSMSEAKKQLEKKPAAKPPASSKLKED